MASDDRTSGFLLRRAREGDAGALGALLHRQIPDLLRWAHGRLPRWMRGAIDTADLVQDALARTIPRIGAFDVRGRHALGAYLRQAVRNRIVDEHRRVGRRTIAIELPDTIVDSAASPLDTAIAADDLARYRSALAALSDADRELIVAHVELGYSHQQLGCMTDRSANAARMALHRAIGRLARQMGER